MGDNDLNSFPPSIDKFELLQVVSHYYGSSSITFAVLVGTKG